MFLDDKNLLAILGPTNTGKTYIAFEKLFTYSSGIFGFPLRLLARENYDKATKIHGLNKIALITGEEKIIPSEAKYFFCTVESMPTNISVECVITDEIQLAADYERGHIFTDRILNLRGVHKTIFLGSISITSILKKLFPNIEIQQKQRFSSLSFLPKQNLSKLKPRSAIIAFNINKIYEIAENLRTHKGGAAVVLGSLSPRTRNAQVEVYEDNKVDYLVATDAIGMGLNLNINHVCFSSLEKFDGRYNRNLYAHEIGQIAGRAGRYKNDGTFGFTKQAGNLDPKIINLIENHNFDQIQKIYWRNSDIKFETIESVLSSLKKFPISDFFIHKKNAIDELNFRMLIDDGDVKQRLNSIKNIKLLWDVCRIPDFEKIFNDNYISFLKKIFLIIIKNDRIPQDWINSNISKLEDTSGGIPELSLKISQIRTWTYISNHQNWLDDPFHWQQKTQNIENLLSDNLHNSLTNKFIDSSSKYFMHNKNIESYENIEINKTNEIVIDNKIYGFIHGFDIKLNKSSFSHSLFLLSHVKKTIRNMIEEKINNFLNAPNNSINLGNISNISFDSETYIYWGEENIGKLKRGTKIYSPQAEALNAEFLSAEKKLLVSAKLQNWIDNEINSTLSPIKEKLDDAIGPEVRAIAFNCFENLGTLPVLNFINYMKTINEEDKLNLSKLGIRTGAKYFYMPNLLKKKPIELKSILWKVFNISKSKEKLPLPIDGRVSFLSNIKLPESYWNSIGYIFINKFASRVDMFEKIFYLARQKLKYGPFIESPDLMSPLGCGSDQLSDIMKFCGYGVFRLGDEKKMYFFTNNKIPKKNTKEKVTSKKNIIKKNKKTKLTKADPNSPFAILEKLL